MEKYRKKLKVQKKFDVKFFALFDVNVFNQSHIDENDQNLTHTQSRKIHEKVSQKS